ncbi:DUF2334 domain-containing protein [Tepidanaerobacter syntrophicus]|uniref:DUF2334 domain-containing protein n=1 Tax=Tepidanaerobacter syntrophicus TaxID=224999 RepID=UPI0017666743|nr:polysaccharide deacetylase family protein [Tepidanaerobacter syntrophicus]HHV82827.1 DUF2334 domain-containing protein [Tepidanaerobacter syntrophicus]
MMCKSKICYFVSIILVAVFFTVSAGKPVMAQEMAKDGSSTKNVLIIYDRRNYFGFKADEVTAIVNLLYHFNVNTEEIMASSYKAGMMQKYDCTVYIGISDEKLKNDLLKDITDYKKPFLFVGKGIQYLLRYNPMEGVEFKGNNLKPVKVKYKDREFILKTERFFQEIILKNDAGQVFSTVSDEQSLYPYIVRLSNLWYVSCLDTQGVLFYILADVLHDFFEEYHDTSSPKIYVRIEDVHAERSIENLYKIADYLQQENVPYMVALIPSFYDFKTKNIFDLKDNKRFADCIKYMQDSGGSIVLHGYTHQIHKDMPGEGFEFWDGEKDQPLPVDMKKWVDERINAAIDECTEVGIGPIAFEAPHYAASSEAYKNLKRYFSTIIGHLQTSDRGYTTTPYPYTLHYSSLYNNLIPENLGYVDPDDLLYKEHIFEELEKVAIVRDYTAGFYFHSYLDPKLLEPIIVEIKKRGIDFLDLKQENNWVKGANYIISSQSGNIQIEQVKTLKEPLLIRIFRRIFIVLLILVTTICLRLLYIFLDRRRKAKEYLFKE